MEEAHSRLLIIFYRNPRKGKVKTRLAASLGDDEALRIYQALVSHTQDITRDLPFETVVYYSEKIDDTDVWSGGNHQKSLQQGNDLGQRMMDAFEAGFKRGHRSICIIGTDCYQLTRAVILSAFKGLLLHDAVIGPALDEFYGSAS